MMMSSSGSKSWSVFIITHRHIFPWLYTKDSDFNLTNYRFINISPSRLQNPNLMLYNTVNLPEEPGFIRLGDYYVETEAIYNIYKNPRFYDGLDYLGFLHYDFEFKLPDGSGNITEQIHHYIQDKPKAHISFQTNNALGVYNLMMLADENQPNTLCGPGYNCYDYILRDYNHYFQTQYSLDDMFRLEHINMCSSFLMDVPTFQKMMGFISYVIESRKLEVFDTSHQFKIHGHLMERYYSVFLIFEYERFLTLMLPHHGFLKTIQ